MFHSPILLAKLPKFKSPNNKIPLSSKQKLKPVYFQNTPQIEPQPIKSEEIFTAKHSTAFPLIPFEKPDEKLYPLLSVTLFRSPNSTTQSIRRTLDTLGLRKRYQTIYHKNNRENRGNISIVSYFTFN